MQILGQIINLNPNGTIVVKARNVPRIGAVVVDENLKTIGKIFDIFGPIVSPYVTIKSKYASRLKNKKLYFLTKKNKRR